MQEYKINDLITLKLIGRETVIFINGERVNQCKFLLFNIPVKEIEKYEDIQSIDELESRYGRQSEGKHIIDPETEFWGHCSNIEAWAENDYDTRILHRTIAFPLLRKLADAGDPVAKKVFKDEIAMRLESGAENVFWFLIEQNYLDYLTKEEINAIFSERKIRDKILTSKSYMRDIHNRYSLEYHIVPRLHNLIHKGFEPAIDLLKEIILEAGKDPENYLYFKKNGYLKYLNEEEIEKITPNEELSEKINLIIDLEKLIRRPFHLESEEEFLKNIKVRSTYSRSHFSYMFEGNDIVGIHIQKEGDRDPTRFPELIFKLRNLRFLALTGLKLARFPDEISQLKNLELLSLEGSRVENIPESIGDLTKLEYLDLSRYNLYDNIPESLGKLKNLKILKLCTRNVNKLPETMGSLTLLEELDCGDYNKCLLEELPQSITDLHNLKLLNLRNNTLQELPNDIGDLVNLERLNLEGNSLKDLPDSIGQLKSLKELIISKNQIVSLPESIGNLRNLKVFYFESNKLERLPDSIGELKSLEKISYRNNPLKEVPSWYGELPNFDITAMYPLIEMVADVGSSEAEKVIWKEVTESFKEGDVTTVFTLMRKKLFNNISIEKYENLLLSPRSKFRNELKRKMIDKEKENDAFEVITQLIRRNSTKIYSFLKTTIPQLIKTSKTEEFFRITKYLFLLNNEDIEQILLSLNNEQIKELMRAFIVEYPYESNDMYFITELKNKPFKYIYDLVERLQDKEYQEKIIQNMFLDCEYSYFVGLNREIRVEFLKGLNPNLTRLFINVLLSYVIQDYQNNGLDGEESHYYELKSPFNMFIQLKKVIWKEIFDNFIDDEKNENRLEILLFLFVENFLDVLSQEEMNDYFRKFSIEEISKVLMGFYQSSDSERGIYLRARDFLKIGDLGVDIALYLVEYIQQWAYWEQIDTYSTILKELQEKFPEKIRSFLKKLVDDLKEFENQRHFEFIFYRILPLLNDTQKTSILLNPNLNVLKWILDLDDGESRYYALEGYLKTVKDMPSDIVKQYQVVIETLLKENQVSDEFLFDLCKGFFEKIDEDYLYSLIIKKESSLIDNIIQRFRRGDDFHYNYYTIPFYIIILVNINDISKVREIFNTLPQDMKFKVLSSLIGEIVELYGDYGKELRKILRTILILTEPDNVIRLLYIGMKQCAGYPDFYRRYQAMYSDAKKFSSKQSWSLDYSQGVVHYTKDGKRMDYTCNFSIPDGRRFIAGYIQQTHTLAVIKEDTNEWIIGFTDQHRVISGVRYGNPIFNIPNTTIIVGVSSGDFFLYSIGEYI